METTSGWKCGALSLEWKNKQSEERRWVPMKSAVVPQEGTEAVQEDVRIARTKTRR